MKKQKRNDLYSIKEKTLEELLGSDWPELKSKSYVATNVHRLRNVPLKQYRLPDLRLMIGQGFGLSYLVPIALDHLEKYPLAEAELYPGDLLHSILSIDDWFWTSHNDLLLRLRKCLQKASLRIKKSVTTKELENKIGESLTRFGAH
ncbi:MAG TPA: contact-dependent growth inhibition system immunity protein [Acidobacteriota bacterium]|jgi:hypothetical protein